ncbi:MAG: hypothetical protein NUV53_00780 [Patescibacteria group bacterium]|nr:hypothetical protein [Patescibacteria group bacterium]
MKTLVLILTVIGITVLGANAQTVFVATNTPTATNTFVYKQVVHKATTQPRVTITAAPTFQPRTSQWQQQAPRTTAGSVGAAPNAQVGTVQSVPRLSGGGVGAAPNAPLFGGNNVRNSVGRRWTTFLGGLISVDTTPPPPRYTTHPQWTTVQVLPGQVIETHEIKNGFGQSITVRQGKGGVQNLSGQIRIGGK